MNRVKNSQNLLKKILFPIIFVTGTWCVYRLVIVGLISIHSFLVVNRPVASDILIVEGWIFDYMLDAAAEEIKKGNYKRIITIGDKKTFPEHSKHSNFTSMAEQCKAQLIKRGISPSAISVVTAPAAKYQTTFKTAVAVSSWLQKKQIKAVNVFTGGPHGRKSLLLFQNALGENIKVGVISCKIKHYDPVYWWTSWRGTQVTLRYLFGYFYALLLMAS